MFLLDVFKDMIGVERPTSRKVMVKIVSRLILFTFGVLAPLLVGELLDWPQMEVDQIQPFLESDRTGSYLPIIYSNVGNDMIKNLKVTVKTCHMNASRSFDIGNLSAQSGPRTLKFYDKDTVGVLEEKECTFRQRNQTSCEIIPYSVGTDRFVPLQNCTFYVCSPCPYSINLLGDGYVKEVNGSYSSPYKYTYAAASLISTGSFDLKSDLFKNRPWVNETPFAISIISQNEMCHVNGSECIDKPDFIDPTYLFRVVMPSKDKRYSGVDVTFWQKYPNDFEMIRNLTRQGYVLANG